MHFTPKLTLAKPINNDTREAIMAQIHEPKVHEVQRRDTTACCVAWESEGIYHEFSPDLGRSVQGRTRAEAKEAMETLLQQAYLENPAVIKDIVEVKQVYYLLKGGDTPGKP